MSTSPVTGVVHTGITVSDLDKAIALFRDALGLGVSPTLHCSGEMFEQITGIPGCVIDIAYVTLPGHTVELLCYANPKDKKSSALRPCDNGHMHLSLNVSDIDATIARLRRHGFEPVNPVQTVADGELAGTRAIYTRGPDNLIIELMEPPHTAGSASHA